MKYEQQRNHTVNDFKGFDDSQKHKNIYDILNSGGTLKQQPIQQKESETLGTKFSNWLRVANAKYYRNICNPYGSLICPQISDLEKAFDDGLSNVWLSYGNPVSWKVFPEIHVQFFTVEIYGLRATWNRRDINLKRVLLTELRRNYINYARVKGYKFDAWFYGVVTEVWQIRTTLIIEVPYSPFYFTYPQYVPVLAPEEYWRLKASLNTRSEL